MQVLFILFIVAQPLNETNPLKIVLGTGFNLYQKIISPAQGDVCNFEPSCSQFAKEAIKKYGQWGVLMGADRLMRCNPWAYQHCDTYYSGIKNYKIYDPIENNFIFGEIRKANDTTDSE
jgi:hypothetical protein